MREIEFRGKQTLTGEWIYGSLLQYKGLNYKIQSFIMPDGIYGVTIEVDAATIGQYIGLKDKNGVKIFEGDIVTFNDYQGYVKYFDSSFEVMSDGTKFYDMMGPKFSWHKLEVIGNVHNNKEMKVENEITDKRLETAIKKQLRIVDSEPITKADMFRLTKLNVPWRDIKSLKGLEYAVNLKYLNLWGNKITDISPLADLKNLKNLNLRDNKIIDILPLAGLVNLTGLDLSSNNIVDISLLASLKNLKDLYLSGNNITDISSLASLVNLKSLSLWGNKIIDVSSLAGLKNLKIHSL